MIDTTSTESTPYKALVTGGGGFLGRAVVQQLLERGCTVRSLSRGAYPELVEMGVELVRGSVADADIVAEACRDCDVVFHVAAKAAIWGPYDEFHQTNVLGTQNVIDACRKLGIQHLVHTSSPSVIFHGTDIEGVDESAPYPARYNACYPKTKALAEQRILAANDETLRTVALRPHIIWGPRDNHLIPRLIARAKAGRLRRIGTRNKLVDTVYVDNAARAHLLAADKLRAGAPVAGKAYFISQDEPIPLWDMINRILDAAGVPVVTKTVPRGLTRAGGALCEFVYKTFRLQGEPPMTRFVTDQMSTAHWFDISAARRDLGYEPTVSIDEGLERLKAWFHRNPVEMSR